MRPFKLAIITTDEDRFIEAIKNSKLNTKIKIVITNNPDSRAIESAKRYGIKYEIIDHQDFSDRKEHDKAIMEKLNQEDIELVILAGYRRLIKSKEFLDSYGSKMINIHNSFLPNFPGARPHEEVFKAGLKKSGYSIHYVNSVMDRGEIILQEEINIENCKNPQEVYDKITLKACEGVLRVVNMFAEMKVRQSL